MNSLLFPTSQMLINLGTMHSPKTEINKGMVSTKEYKRCRYSLKDAVRLQNCKTK